MNDGGLLLYGRRGQINAKVGHAVDGATSTATLWKCGAPFSCASAGMEWSATGTLAPDAVATEDATIGHNDFIGVNNVLQMQLRQGMHARGRNAGAGICVLSAPP